MESYSTQTMQERIINITDESRPFVNNLELSQTIDNNKKNKVKKYIAISSIFGIFFIGIILIIFLLNAYLNNTVIDSSIKTISLDINDLMKWDKSKQWNIIKYVYGRDLLFKENDTLKAIYPQGSWSPSAGSLYGYGGFNFYAQPSIFPSNEICFSYDFKFNKNFVWVKGGKLPGIWIGDIGASGGNHINSGYSYRISWKNNGQVEAYLYIPENQLNDLELEYGYINNSIYGLSLWRGFTNFTVDKWYQIKLGIKLNSFSDNKLNYDGIISLKIDNNTISYDKLLWIQKPNTINGIMMDSFFGGSDNTFATPVTTFIYFRNFNLSNRVCT